MSNSENKPNTYAQNGQSTQPSPHLLQLQEALRRAFRLLITNADSNSDILELPIGQVRCLRRIMEQDGCKLVDVARETNLSLPNASRLVDRLVQRALVLRETDPNDRRAVRLHATAEARAMLESINQQRLTHLSEATRLLSGSQIDQTISDLKVLADCAEQAFAGRSAQSSDPEPETASAN